MKWKLQDMMNFYRSDFLPTLMFRLVRDISLTAMCKCTISVLPILHFFLHLFAVLFEHYNGFGNRSAGQDWIPINESLCLVMIAFAQKFPLILIKWMPFGQCLDLWLYLFLPLTPQTRDSVFLFSPFLFFPLCKSHQFNWISWLLMSALL